MPSRLPTPPVTDDQKVNRFLNELVRELEDALDRKVDKPTTKNSFVYTGALTKTYTIDAAAGTLADVRNIVVTFLDELRQNGNIA